ncbi:MAG TPA: DJ-1/PfpI family protein [Patescibacteria group bacterium]|nr:DJ-1/PfpI family protein [Patescibacteria group bacterium]
MKTVFFYVHPGYADWEGGFILPELRENSPFPIKTMAAQAQPVKSMGGLQIMPDLTLAELEPAAAALVILPGGYSWIQHPEEHAGIVHLLPRLRQNRVPLAAICAATLAFARLGWLNDIPHTSNGLDFLQSQVPDYAGAAGYVDQPAATGGQIITASGIGAIEFAYEILTLLEVYDDSTRRQWFALYKHGILPPPEFWVQKH